MIIGLYSFRYDVKFNYKFLLTVSYRRKWCKREHEGCVLRKLVYFN